MGLKRFKYLKRGYVIDRHIFLYFMLPILVLIVWFGTAWVQYDTHYYMKLECTGLECSNPLYGDCHRVVEKEAQYLCAQKTLPPGEYGKEPPVIIDLLLPVSLVCLAGAWYVNHRQYNKRGKNED